MMRTETGVASTLSTSVLSGLDDPAVGRDRWNALASSSAPGSVFSTHEWLTAWWTVYGRGRLRVIAVERDGEVTTIAPMFVDGGMAYFVGAGGSDYLDLIGRRDEPSVTAALERLLTDEPGLLGVQLHLVPDASSSGTALAGAARALGLTIHDEGGLVAPRLDLRSPGASDVLRKKSLVRHENHFQRSGDLRTTHTSDAARILEQLDPFFTQHVDRWTDTGSPSLFLDEQNRRFYRALVDEARDAGWLRFTRVEWEGRAIAYHFGFCHQGTYLWYKPTFAIELARRSPGEVLLKHLLAAALEEGATVFDLGIGEEAFKRRFATDAPGVRTWGLYPPGRGT